MKRSGTIIILAAGHGLNDLIAGYYLGTLVQLQMDILQIGAGLFIYNLLAFGGQYPVALWLQRSVNPKVFLLAAYGLNISSVILFFFIPSLSIVLTGIASAIYHVAGGTICAKENKATNVGLFAAPGVAGLIAGGYFAYTKVAIDLPILIAAIIFFAVLLRLRIQNGPYRRSKATDANDHFKLDTHDIIMILLLTVISLRSVIWNVFQLVHEKDYHWLIAIAASAFIGKIIGGWLADKIGWRLYAISSLLMATPLITLFKKEMILFCIGIGLLQSGIPATTSLLIHSMKGQTEKAIALTFGTAIITGAVVLYTPLQYIFFSNYFLWSIVIVMLLFLWWTGKKETGLPEKKLISF